MLLIVLTENNWLFEGFSVLLPEMVCRQIKFGENHFSSEVNKASRILVVVDCLIFFRGEWTALNALRAHRHDVTVVWLTHKNTGRVFPQESRGERVLAKDLGIVSLRLALRRASQGTEIKGYEDYVSASELSLAERRLLPYFVSGMNIHLMSRLTGITAKTLYTHRIKILAKTGFRKLVFLQFVYERNWGLPGISELANSDEQGSRGKIEQ